MSNSKEIVVASSPDFVTELLPSAQWTALLYHLSYLCLAKFPKLERVLRERAVETQLLFGSSEVLLLKCAATSKNLVSTLLPALKVAVEKDKTILAMKSLEKARAWITEIVDKVEQMVERYEKHNHSVASCTSDVILEKAETEKKQQRTSKEIEAQEKAVAELTDTLKKNNEEVGQIEAKIAQKIQELHNHHVKDSSSKSNGLGIFAALVPFVGPIVKSIHDAKTGPGVAAKTQLLSSELTQLSIEKSSLKNIEWSIHVRLTDMQLKLASIKIENDCQLRIISWIQLTRPPREQGMAWNKYSTTAANNINNTVMDWPYVQGALPCLWPKKHGIYSRDVSEAEYVIRKAMDDGFKTNNE